MLHICQLPNVADYFLIHQEGLSIKRIFHDINVQELRHMHIKNLLNIS